MPSAESSAGPWWIIAVVSGAALAVAVRSIVTTKRAKMVAVSAPLIGAGALLLNSAARGFEGAIPLKLYSLTMLGLAAQRVIFAGFLRRLFEQHRAGKPVEKLKGWQTATFLAAFAASVAAFAAVLHQLPSRLT